MIVKNKEASICKANEMATKLLGLIVKESQQFNCEDDPAEQIYLGIHCIGNLIAKICISIEGYSKIYGIPNSEPDYIKECINDITNEYLKINRTGD